VLTHSEAFQLPAAGSRRGSQLRSLTAQELRQRMTGLWALPALILAFGPALLLLAVVLITKLVADSQDTDLVSLEQWRQAYAEIYHSLMLRVCVFFGCAAVFLNTFRSAMAGRYLHYSFLSPVSRQTVVAAKYLSGLIYAGAAFVAGTLAMWVVIHLGPDDTARSTAMLLDARGLRLAASYVAITLLACAGYGAVFLALGLRFRNPIFPTVVLMVWESINLFLPAGLQKLSIIHHLQSFAPIPVKTPLISVVAAPTPLPQAVVGLVAVSALLLWLARRWAREMELDYGSD
jgi:hypothetical protein